ncbi:TlpA family protein disulfide reductase [Euzebyella saccharophila]|uniref:TlpA family protein disulfide reductase n=1 Tax=Euzebyella saccharophila TaxID=679664 RepID=A0ABV8JQL3_9FLAO|nr:TlpA disulfide reductase family protein [Euzebyella saccharophila]
MKNILLTFLILTVFSCQEKKKEISSKISITKEKKIEKKKEVVISVNDTISSFFTNLFVDEMQDKPDMLYLGQKENKTTVTIPTQNTIKIIGGDPFVSFFYEMQLEKGDSLLIDIKKIDVNQSKQIEYPIFTLLNSDKTWSENNFGYLLYNYNINNKAILIDEDKFQNNKFDSEKIYTNSIILLDSLKDNNSISDKFYSTNRINQKLKFATSKIREAKNKSIELDIENLGIKLNEEELLDNKEYVSFLRALILYKYFKEDKRVKNSVLFDFVNEQETILNESTKEILLNSYLKSIFFVEKPKFSKYLTKFQSASNNDEMKNKWNSVVDKEKANSNKLNTTNRTVGILTNLVNDNELTFEQVLTKRKGKIVLVDFWASWCAPCRKEMPFLKDLKLKFNETELKIIEISIDKDYSAWLRASKLENLSNEIDNYIISNWEKSNLYKNYNIKTIPRYLLFGKDGKIIDENAPRPSEKELIELIKASI